MSIDTIAVIGAGTMGSGIALACAGAGLRVTLIDATDEGLARGRDIIRSSFAAGVKRGRLSQDAADEQASRIGESLDLADAAGADVVIEAVFEDLAVKTRLLATLDSLVPPDRLVATNTSTLSVTELARATAHPERIAGLHFFSPAHVMKLLEIVRGDQTAPAMLEIAFQLARKLGKVPVIAGDGFGFIGNRMMLDGYFREAEQLLLESASPAQVDGAIERFGFAMGPFRVSDLGGLDVGTKARTQLRQRESRPDPYFAIADRLTALGRLGQKTGSGFYRYEHPGGRDALPDPAVAPIVAELAAEHGIAQRAGDSFPAITDEEIVERCLLALINMGAVVLDEGVATRASDIDVVWTNGYGFPRALGGPMAHADRLGLPSVADRIRHYRGVHDHYWRPAALIERLAASRGSFEQWDRERGV